MLKKYSIVLFLSFFALSIISQEFDSSYLESLPADIKDDVLDRVDKKDEDKKVYRSSEFSSKIQKEEDLKELKKRIEESLKQIEEKLQQEDSKKSDEFVLFGNDFFNTIQTSFMPVNEPNFDSSYVLDYGDVIEVQLIGNSDSEDTYTISRDGSILIPEIGKVNLSGLTFSDASNLIKNKVNDVFLATEALISLVDVRDVNVLVSGNSLNPGVYTLSGNSNILHAVSVSGGINKYGSYREINLVRNNQIIETLDVYDLLIAGKYNLKKRLQTGDIIFVEPLKNIVTIDGAVKRPGKYELKENQNLIDAISYSNGLSKEADQKYINLQRILDGKIKSIPITNISQFESLQVKDGDHIFIRKHSFRNVDIDGAVLKPGRYVMVEGETVADLIKKAGGYTKNAYPFGAVFENENALEINKKSKEILYQEFLDNIIALSEQNPTGDTDFGSIIALTRDIKNSMPSGRIVIDLSDENYSVPLSNNDKLLIPEKVNHIYIYGEVSSEGTIEFNRKQDVDFYVRQSGGYKKYADKEAIYILQPNGNTLRYETKRSLFASQPLDIQIYPGSIIYVPRKLDNSAFQRLSAQAYVSILGNLGIALASLSSITD